VNPMSNWREDPPTEKQLTAIQRMRRVLGSNVTDLLLPTSKGEACDEIGRLVATKRLRANTCDPLDHHLGDDAPDPDSWSEMVPEFNRNGIVGNIPVEFNDR